MVCAGRVVTAPLLLLAQELLWALGLRHVPAAPVQLRSTQVLPRSLEPVGQLPHSKGAQTSVVGSSFPIRAGPPPHTCGSSPCWGLGVLDLVCSSWLPLGSLEPFWSGWLFPVGHFRAQGEADVGMGGRGHYKDLSAASGYTLHPQLSWAPSAASNNQKWKLLLAEKSCGSHKSPSCSPFLPLWCEGRGSASAVTLPSAPCPQPSAPRGRTTASSSSPSAWPRCRACPWTWQPIRTRTCWTG